ncbi:MAG: Flp pilus assembly protein CpaB [Sphingomonadaceae bacterium]
MDAKKIILLVVALIVAGGTAFMAKTMFSQASAPQVSAAVMPAKDGPQILVATRSLPVGTIIEADSFRYQPWPSELIENAYYVKGEADPASLQGTVVRTAVTAGQPLTKGALVKSGDRGFLAAALGPGMRAVTVPVSAQSGVAGFVFPGDRVDLVLTQTVSGDGGGPALKTSETFIRNVRVLAVDQSTVPEDDQGNKLVKVVATVTLEATPRIAEKIAVAQTIGSVSLSLRSIADNTAELERAIAAGEVKVPEGNDPKAEKSMLLAVASRPVDTDTTFVTGADVSRFQRRSVPRQSIAPGAAPSAPAYSGGAADPQAYGPVVKVLRGSNKTPDVIPVGGK